MSVEIAANEQGFVAAGIHVPLLGLAVTFLCTAKILLLGQKYNC